MTRTRFVAVLLLAGVLSLLLAVVPGCDGDSDSPAGPSTSGTVTGRVVSANLRPIANAPVVITGLPATTTDANGVFTIPGVARPYDVTVVISAVKLGITYRGLTRSDPTLLNIFTTPPAANSATITGTVSGGAGYPLPPNHVSRAGFVASEVGAGATPNTGSGAYSIGLSWDGTSTATGTLHALQWENTAGGMPQAYKGYATKTGVTVSNGGTFAGQNLALASVTAGTISGTVTVPATVTLAAKALSLVFSSKLTFALGSESGATTAFTYNVPNVAGTTLTVTAQGTSGGGLAIAAKTGIAVGASTVALTLPEVPQLSLPVNAATNVTNTTPFTWTTAPSGIYLALFNGPAGEADYLVVAGTASTTIPDLTNLGLGLPAGASYSWGVYLFGPHASIDAAAGPDGFVPVGDALTAMSSTRTFTTAP